MFIGPGKYFFDLANCDEIIPDVEGFELRDTGESLTEIVEAIEGLRNYLGFSSSEWLGWSLEVRDASGQTVHSIPLGGFPHWPKSDTEAPEGFSRLTLQ
jgi:hypothetical protein